MERGWKNDKDRTEGGYNVISEMKDTVFEMFARGKTTFYEDVVKTQFKITSFKLFEPFQNPLKGWIC